MDNDYRKFVQFLKDTLTENCEYETELGKFSIEIVTFDEQSAFVVLGDGTEIGLSIDQQ